MNYLRLFLLSILLSCGIVIALGYAIELFRPSMEKIADAIESYVDWIADFNLHKVVNVILGAGLPIGVFVGSILVLIRFTLDLWNLWSKMHQ